MCFLDEKDKNDLFCCGDCDKCPYSMQCDSVDENINVADEYRKWVYMNTHFKLKNVLKKYRIEKGFTQKQLGDLIGTSKNTISSIEVGNFSPTAYTAALLCDALECKFEDLFFLEKQ